MAKLPEDGFNVCVNKGDEGMNFVDSVSFTGDLVTITGTLGHREVGLGLGLHNAIFGTEIPIIEAYKGLMKSLKLRTLLKESGELYGQSLW